MAKMILGRQIIARVLSTKDIQPYLEAGLTMEFMADSLNPAYAAVFTGQDIDAWVTILKHYQKYGKVIETQQFRMSYPPENYRLVEPTFDDRELLDLARNSISMYETQVGTTEAQRYIEVGQPLKAAEIMMETARRVLSQQAEAAITTVWDSPDYDLESRLDVVRAPGPGFGIPELDEHWPGSQAGELHTMVGRAKAGKSTFLLQAAYHAWHGRDEFGSQEALEPMRVLFVTFEMPQEDIRDMLMCYGAGVNPAPFLASTKRFRPTQDDRDKLMKFYETEFADVAEAFTVVQPISRYTVTDLEVAMEKSQAEIVYIDGIYFMTDATTGNSPGSNAFAQDNMARDLKTLAMRHRIPIWITHQAREKQLGKSGGGFDDTAMMGGTGFRMASDRTYTIDKGEDGVVTIKNTAARRGYLPTICGEWDWPVFEFRAYAAKDDDEEDY